MTLADHMKRIKDNLPKDPIVPVSEEWILEQAKLRMQAQEERRVRKEAKKRAAKR